jgi:PAS domain S-box-containing protein
VEWITHEHIVGLFTIIGIIVAMIPRVRGFVIKCWRKTLGKRGHQLDRIEATQEGIVKELHPNGSSSLRDVADRIEDRQHGFDAFLNAQLNIHDVAVFRTDKAGKVLYNNRKHQRLTGFSAMEIEGDGWVNVLHPDDRDRMHESWKDSVEEGREFSEDIRYVHPSTGEAYNVHVNAYREVDADGVIRGYLGVVVPEDDKLARWCPHMDKCAVGNGDL